MEFWLGIARRYGGIARVRLKGRHVYLISDPDLIYELLITKRQRYRKNTRYRAAVETLGEGLLLSEGEEWRQQRRIAQPTFKADYVKSRAAMMTQITADLIETWQSCAAGGEPRDVHEDFLRLSQRIAGNYLMGPGFDRSEPEFYRAAITIKDNWPLPPKSIVGMLRPPPAQREVRLLAAVKDIDALIAAYLAHHRPLEFANCGVVEFLASESRKNGRAYGDKMLRDQLMTLFFAGHETSATSLSWIHYLLSTHPDCRERLRQEVASVVGSESRPGSRHLDRLVYTEQVVNESLRLYSPIHSISRVALQDDVIGGYAIPAGSMIYVSLYATHRLPAIWPEPDRFDPDRFAPGAAAGRPRFAFIPYAAGHRNCIGAPMATAELKLAIAQIAQHYTLDLAPGARVIPEAGTTMYPKHGMNMIIRPSTLPQTVGGQTRKVSGL